MSIPTNSWARIALIAICSGAAFGQEHWVATWAAAPQETRVLTPPGAPQGRGAQQAPARPNGPAPITAFHDQTVRMIVRASIGGPRARVELSNTFGTKPVTIGAAHIALRQSGPAIVSGSDHGLTFSGKASATIPPGAEMVSDPVNLQVPQLGDVVISLYLPGESGPPTMHATGLHTTYVVDGDMTAAASLADAKTTASWFYISGLYVTAPADAGTIVAFGDSITDGATSTVDTDHSWPSLLARRLVNNPATAHWAVVNEGISGNRILRDQAGANGLARLDRDVFSQPGVKWMTLMLGINDIGRATGSAFGAAEPVTADELIAGLRQIVERAHVHGIKVLAATLTPYEGAGYYSETGEAMREAVNQWIRTSGAADAVVDFDKVVQDPNHPKQIRSDYNIRDHLHPNDAGYQAMADAVDLAIFTGGGRPAASAAVR
ncbi:MAG TPA: SGNH/GDSL hydrolase family protein [Bryobacteraceae bacterium]|nr:SGNH/GDSL hydrolase family protein [Bryobacteraceae bacterium]